MELAPKVSATISRYSMLGPNERVLVGLSGGPDSTCLLVVLSEISEGMGLELHAAYVDHGLRPQETPQEIEFCKGLTKKLGVRFHLRSVDVKAFATDSGLSTQEAARELRYEALKDVAREAGCTRIALGHNQEDQAETLLMRLIRGAGPKGLSGIPPVRDHIIRPLIETNRDEIVGFLDSRGIGSVTDSSNLKDDYLRNRLRSTLMPLIKEFNPNAAATMARTADILREEDAYLEADVSSALGRLVARKSETTVELLLAPMEGMERVFLRRAIRRALDEAHSLRGIAFEHIEDIAGLITDSAPGDSLDLPKNIRAVRRYTTVLITTERPVRLESRSLSDGGEVVMLEAGLIMRASSSTSRVPDGGDAFTIIVDAEKLTMPLGVRPRRDGDFFYPAGFGKRKKLQDFFVDEKVPRDERDAVPVVTSGEDVVWVAGMRADERFVPTDSTRKTLLLQLGQLRS